MAKRSRHLPALAQMFRILGDETRLRILLELHRGPHNVTALVKKLKMPQPTVSHHLALLRASEMVVTQRRGKEIYYSLNGQQARSQKALRAVQNAPGGVRLGPLLFGTGPSK